MLNVPGTERMWNRTWIDDVVRRGHERGLEILNVTNPQETMSNNIAIIDMACKYVETCKIK